MRPKTYFYKTGVSWERERRGYLTSPGKPDMELGAPPEFKGHEGIWTPESLFVAAVEGCIMTSFFAFSRGLNLVAYESKAEGRLDLDEQKMSFVFTTVSVTPRVVVASEEDVAKAREALNMAEKRCLVTNSLKTEVVVQPEIVVSE